MLKILIATVRFHFIKVATLRVPLPNLWHLDSGLLNVTPVYTCEELIFLNLRNR